MAYLINGRYVWVNSYTLIDLRECKKIQIEPPEDCSIEDITEQDIENFFKEYKDGIKEGS